MADKKNKNATATATKKVLTKDQLISNLSVTTGLTKVQVNKVIESLSQQALSTLQTTGSFTLPGMGKLMTATRPLRQVRNPRTGEKIFQKEKRVVKFRPSLSFRESVAKSL
jgi:DNA-binding protein HU-beta